MPARPAPTRAVSANHQSMRRPPRKGLSLRRIFRVVEAVEQVPEPCDLLGGEALTLHEGQHARRPRALEELVGQVLEAVLDEVLARGGRPEDMRRAARP